MEVCQEKQLIFLYLYKSSHTIYFLDYLKGNFSKLWTFVKGHGKFNNVLQNMGIVDYVDIMMIMVPALQLSFVNRLQIYREEYCRKYSWKNACMIK